MIILCVDSTERFWFFKRLRKSLIHEYRVKLITTEPVVKLLSLVSRIDCLLVSRVGNAVKLVDFDTESIESMNGMINYEESQRSVASAVYAFEKELDSVERIAVWNGHQVLGLAATYVAKKYDIDIRYLEISNLPNSVFSDSKGVNGHSSLCESLELLDQSEPVSIERQNAWFESYQDYKCKPIPQSLKNNTGKILSLLNYLAKGLYPSICRPKFSTLYNRARGQGAMDLEYYDTSNMKGFIFVPLQVSSDTQLKLNSDYGNLDLIAEAVKRASANEVVVVKIHPAEIDKAEIEKIYSLKKNLNFLVSAEPTLKLIMRSNLVVVINSTVGLEAMIYGRPIVVLGRALYQGFDDERLKKYIHNYLVNGVDYFSDERIPPNLAKRIMDIK